MGSDRSRPPSSGHYRGFDEFYAFYLSEHAHPVSRRLHVAGTALALLLLVLAAGLRLPWLAVAGLASGYGCAWVGHFFFEKNRPATFTHPWWSLRGDLRLLAETLAGKRKW